MDGKIHESLSHILRSVLQNYKLCHGFPTGSKTLDHRKIDDPPVSFFLSVVSMTVKSRNDAQAGEMFEFKSVILRRDARRPAMDDVHQLSIHELLLGRGFKYVFSPLSLGK